MDQLQQVTNVKNNPSDLTSTCSLETLNKQKNNSFEVESDYLPISAVYIKTEMCPNYDMEYEPEEPMVKIECKDMFDENEQDPLDNSNKVKVADEGCDKHYSSNDEEPESPENRESNSIEQLPEKQKQSQGCIEYTCHTCQKCYIQKGSLMEQTHTVEKSFPCSNCKKSFKTKHLLDTHILTHSKKKRVVCDICNRSFSRQSGLNAHRLLHTGIKPFACRKCNKTFARKSNLNAHERIHTGGDQYICDYCDQPFSSKPCLIHHIRRHTGEKPYSCPTCNKSFPTTAGLRYHKRTTRH